MKRVNEDFIDQYIKETEELSSPEIFRRWAAIAAVAGALERKVWTRSRNMDLYPNLYTILVGPPGVGKTVAIDPVRLLWRGLEGVHVARSNVSRASLTDHLARANRAIVRPDSSGTVSFNSLLVASNELQVFLSAYESDFIGLLTDLYDCKWFSEEKRTKDLQIDIDNPQLNILAATTPSYLNELFADKAWDQGFSSRTIFIYSGEILRGEIFVEEAEERNSGLPHDLRAINKLFGKYVWEEDAKDAWRAWYNAGGPPIPDHPKLLHYTPRRHAQLLKLCMVSAASSSNLLRITPAIFSRALGWLLEAEAVMPEIFKSHMGSDSKIMEDAWHFAYTIYIKTGKPVQRAKLLEFLTRNAPVIHVDRLLEMMIKTGKLKEVLEKDGTRYVPQDPL